MAASLPPAFPSTEKIREAILSGRACPPPERPNGCCRVYVYVDTDDAAQARAVSKVMAEAAQGLATPWLKKPYGVGCDALYVGYDNASGLALAMGRKICNALREIGVRAYREEIMD